MSNNKDNESYIRDHEGLSMWRIHAIVLVVWVEFVGVGECQTMYSCTSWADCNYAGCNDKRRYQSSATFGCEEIDVRTVSSTGVITYLGAVNTAAPYGKCWYHDWDANVWYCPLPCKTSCPAGQYVLSCACTACPVEKYKTLADGSSCLSCTTCSSETYQTTACTSTANRVCSSCAATCSAGTYETTACTSTTNRVCNPCPAGTYASSAGATTCTLCPIGTYTSSGSSTSCTPCPQNSYTPSTGSTACTQCSAHV